MESLESFQDLIFLLEKELKQQEDVLYELPYWILKKRHKQLENYFEEQEKKIKKESKKS